MKRSGLKSRLERLESRSLRRPLPRIVFAIYERSAETVIGYSAHNLSVMRLPGEPLDALQQRAWELTGAVTLATLYEAENPPSDDLVGPTPEPAPASDDPFALAGVGRAATRAELERMGAIRVPPERLI